jgi:DNA adenine methylase
VKGYVVLSGYDSEMYRELYAGWNSASWQDYAMGARPRIEMLWLSPNIVQADLFTMAQSGGQ